MKKGKLNAKDVLHLAFLARLKLSDAEVRKLTPQMSETLEYMENLGEVDLVHPGGVHSATPGVSLAEDKAEKERQLRVEEALVNSRRKKGNYFVVKRVI